MLQNLYAHRFECFIFSQFLVLFGSLFFPPDFYENRIFPLFMLLNILTGILMISKNKRQLWLFTFLFLVLVAFFGTQLVAIEEELNQLGQLKLILYFIFYFTVSWNIIKQVWREREVDKKVILGLMSGYISLGFLAFFLFFSIEVWNPGSFQGVLLESDTAFKFRADSIMYYAYITLLTIGYGEIVPVTPVAQKAAILVGLIGQFYMAIIVSVIIEKYIRHSVEGKQS
jgi:voltage-gated potassium channel Kch